MNLLKVGISLRVTVLVSLIGGIAVGCSAATMASPLQYPPFALDLPTPVVRQRVILVSQKASISFQSYFAVISVHSFELD